MLVEEDRSWELVEHRTVQVWEVEEMVCGMVVEVWWILVGEGHRYSTVVGVDCVAWAVPGSAASFF